MNRREIITKLKHLLWSLWAVPLFIIGTLIFENRWVQKWQERIMTQDDLDFIVFCVVITIMWVMGVLWIL